MSEIYFDLNANTGLVDKAISSVASKIDNLFKKLGVKKDINIGGEKAIKDMESLNTSFKQTGDLMDKLGQKSSIFEKAFNFNNIVNAVTTVTDSISQVSDVGIQYESSLAAVGAITGFTGGELDKLGGISRELAKQFGGSATDQLKSFQGILSKFGPEIAKDSDALGLLAKNVNTLSKASGDDAATSMNAITDAMLQMGLASGTPDEIAKNSTMVINALAASAKVGAAEIPQVAEALVVAGVAAKGAGMDMTGVNAAIQTLAIGGKTGAEAGTALRNVLGLMQKNSNEAEKTMKQMGFTLKDLGATLNEKGLPAALEMVGNGMNKFGSQAEKNAALMQIFGTENSAAAGILIENVNKMKEFSAGIDAGVKAQEAESQAAQRMATAEEQGKRIKAVVDDLKISMTQSLGATGMGVMQVMTEMSPLITAFTGLAALIPFDAMKNLGATLLNSVIPNLVITNAQTGALSFNMNALKSSTIYQTAATYASIVAEKARLIATNASAIAMGILNAVMSANPVTLIVIGIAALVAGLIYLLSQMQPVQDAFKYLWEIVKLLAEKAFNWLIDAIKTLGSWFVSFGKWIADIAVKLWNWITNLDFVKKTVAGITAAFNWLKDTAMDVFNWMLGIAEKVKNGLKEVAMALGFKEETKAEVKINADTKPAEKKIEDVKKTEIDANKEVEKEKDKDAEEKSKKAKARARDLAKDQRELDLKRAKNSELESANQISNEIEREKKILDINKKYALEAANLEFKNADDKAKALIKFNSTKEDIEHKYRDDSRKLDQKARETVISSYLKQTEDAEATKYDIIKKNAENINDVYKTGVLNEELLNKKRAIDISLTEANRLKTIQEFIKKQESYTKGIKAIELEFKNGQIDETTAKKMASDLIDTIAIGLKNGTDDISEQFKAVVLKANNDANNEVKSQNEQFNNDLQQINLNKIVDIKLRERELSIIEAEKTYKELMAKANGNRALEQQAYSQFLTAKFAAEAKYRQDTLTSMDAFVNTIANNLTNAFESVTFDINYGDTSSQTKEKIQQLDDEQKATKQALKNNEISYEEYIKKINSLDTQRSEATKSNLDKQQNFWNGYNKFLTSIFNKIEENNISSMQNIAKTKQDTENRIVEIDNYKLALLSKGYSKDSEEYTKAEQEKTDASKKSTDATNQIYGLMASNIGTALGEALVSGKNLAEEMPKLLLDSLMKMIPVFVTQIFASFVATNPILGTFLASGATATLYGLLAAARSAVGYEKGGYTGNYGTTEVAGVVHGQEYVLNATATAKYRNLLEHLNRGGELGTFSAYKLAMQPNITIDNTNIVNELKTLRGEIKALKGNINKVETLQHVNVKTDIPKRINLIVKNELHRG